MAWESEGEEAWFNFSNSLMEMRLLMEDLIIYCFHLTEITEMDLCLKLHGEKEME